jgi:hypothetical protein
MSGSPQAGSFGCNVAAVEATARQLHQVLDELRNFNRRDDAFAGALSSRAIQAALNDFYDDSSDQRKKIMGSVEGLEKMLQGLADGVREVDKALAGSLPDPVTEAPRAPRQPHRVA